MDSLKKAVSSLKDRIVKSPLERSVFDACSDENWGSSNSILHEISEKTFNHEDRQVILKCIWDLLKSPNKEWRRLYKVLNLIEHLLKFGSTACLHEIQDEAFKIRMLQDFSFREGSEEKGIGVRDKAKYLTGMLNDRKVLDEEREKAKKIWNKFSGISSENAYVRESWRGNYDPYVEKKYDSGEVKDIFKESEIKVQKLEKEESVWDKQPGKLPAAPRIIKPPPTGGGGNIFDPVNIKKVNEYKPNEGGMFVGLNPGKGSGGVLPGQTTPVVNNFPEFTNPSPAFVNNSGNGYGTSPAPTYTNPAPTFTNPAPTFTNPAPTFTNPAPTFTNPAPTFTNPAPTFTNPAPTFTNPAPTFTNPAPTFTNPAPTFTNPAPTFTNPAPTFTNPSPTFTNPAPTFTNPAPTFTNPAPTFTNPAPTFTNPAPTFTNPAPTFTNPAPTYTNPAPVFTNPGPSYTNPAPAFTNPGPSYTNPAPTYTNPGPSFTNPPPSYTNPGASYTNLNPSYTNPAPSYTSSYPHPSSHSNPPTNYSLPPNPSYNSNPLMSLNLGRSENVPSASSGNPYPDSRVHANLTGGAGLTMDDMKRFGNAGFTNFQSAPVEPVKVNLEQKLMNLDDLEAGQPKLKEIAKSRW